MTRVNLKTFSNSIVFMIATLFATTSFADNVSDYAANASKSFKPSPVHTPEVPFGWSQSIQGKSIEYVSNKLDDKKAPATIVRLTYTKATQGQGAKGYMQAFAKKNFCEEPNRVGHGFYTVNCKDLNTYAIVIGEVSNLYLIELSGDVDAVAKNLIDSYIKGITTGKHVFHDRDIGDVAPKEYK